MAGDGETGVTVEQRAVPPMWKNGYLVVDYGSGSGVLVDPGDEALELVERLANLGGRLLAVLNTHGHFDHICGNGVVKEHWDVPIYLHRADEWLYRNMVEQATWFGFRYDAPPPPDRLLDGGEVLKAGSFQLEVLHTPGHSPGSVSYRLGDRLFCGDVIFAGSVGRTDLPGGSSETLLTTIREKVLSLPEDVVLYPGHGPTTTVGREKVTNPFLNGELSLG